MHADEVFVEVLRCDIRERVGTLAKRLGRAHKGSVAGVHDCRSTCRRLRTDLELMGRSGFHQQEAARLADRLHRVERSLASARDLDVILIDLDGYLRLNPRRAAGLKGVQKLLTLRRAKTARRAQRKLRRGQRRTLLRDLRTFLDKQDSNARAKGTAPFAKPVLVRHFTHELIWHRYEAVRAFEPTLPGNERTYHKFRSACRDLSLAIELFRGALPDASPIVRDLTALQAQIGEMYDHHTAVTKLRSLRSRGKLEATPDLDAYVEQRVRARDRLMARFEPLWLEHLGRGFRLRLAKAMDAEVPAAA